MPDAKHVVILANSVRAQKYCVAGKQVFPKENGKYDIGPWIRFTDRNDPQGAVSYASTVCVSVGECRPVMPLDIVEATFLDSCANPDHPEDWFFDTNLRWQIVGKATYEDLLELQDAPPILWNDATKPNSVTVGYVRNMGKNAASLYLIRAPKRWKFTFWKSQAPDDLNPGKLKPKQHRELSFEYGGSYHEFSVTDFKFSNRHKIYDRATEAPQAINVPDSTNVFFCLSLTPEFRNRHYKIGATIFEPK